MMMQQNPIIDTFRLVAETRKQLEIVSSQARLMVKAHCKTPEALAAIIEQHGTPVYRLKGGLLGGLALFLLGFEPGFIPPTPGRRYTLLLRWLTAMDPQHPDASHGLFVMPKKLFTVGFLTHQLHHWLACRSGLSGYNPRSQSLYKKFWTEGNGVIGDEVYDMTVEDMVALKDAINRDLEALEFLRNIVAEVFQPNTQASRFRAAGNASA